MTKREMFEAIKAELTNEDMINFIDTEIAALDRKAAASSKAREKKKEADIALQDKILEILAGATEALTTTAIAVLVEISTQKATPLLKRLQEEGKVKADKDAKGKKIFTLA